MGFVVSYRALGFMAQELRAFGDVLSAVLWGTLKPNGAEVSQGTNRDSGLGFRVSGLRLFEPDSPEPN